MDKEEGAQFSLIYEKEPLQCKVQFNAQKELCHCHFCVQCSAVLVFDELEGKGGHWNFEDGASIEIF